MKSVKKRRPDNLKNRREATQFSSERQPSPQAKREGMLRRKNGKELAKGILELTFKGAKESEIKKRLAGYFGVKEADITIDMMIMFRQIEKAIQKADTPAAKFIREAAYGLPKQEIENSGSLSLMPATLNFNGGNPKSRT